MRTSKEGVSEAVGHTGAADGTLLPERPKRAPLGKSTSAVPPQAAVEMEEVRHRQAVLEVWHTAARLGSAVAVTNYFLASAHAGMGIDDEDVMAIEIALPGEPWVRDLP